MALGAMIMAANLPVRLRIVIPAADNNISGNAFRPGDIIKSRSLVDRRNLHMRHTKPEVMEASP